MKEWAVGRRRFLKVAGAGGAAAALAACGATATPEVVEKEVTRIVEGTPQVVEQTVVVKETVVVEKEVTAAVAQAEAVTLAYGFWGDEIRGNNFAKLADALTAELPNIKIDLQRKPFGQYWESLEVQVAGGISPDLSFMTPEYLYHFWKANAILDLTDMVQRDQLDMSEWVADGGEGRIEGRQLAMPYTNGIEIFYYNVDLFDAAGIGYPTKDWTWDDVRTAAQALTKGEGNTQQWGIWVDNSAEQGWGPLALGNRGWPFSGARYVDGGGGDFDPSGGVKAAADSPEMVAALQWWVANICELNLQPNAGAYSAPPGMDSGFQSGQIGMYIAGTFGSPSIAQSQFNWSVSYIPRSPTTKELRSPSYAIPNVAFRASKHPEEAWQALKWYSGETAQTMLVDLNMKEPTLKSALTKLKGPVDAWANVVLDLYLNFDWNMSTFVFDHVTEATEALQSALDRAFLCEVGLDQAIAEGNAAAAAALQG